MNMRRGERIDEWETTSVTPGIWKFVPTPGKLYLTYAEDLEGKSDAAIIFVVKVHEERYKISRGVRRLVVGFLSGEHLRELCTEPAHTDFYHYHYFLPLPLLLLQRNYSRIGVKTMDQPDEYGPETSYGFKVRQISPGLWNFIPTPGKLYKVTDTETREAMFVFVVDVYEVAMHSKSNTDAWLLTS